MMIKQCWFINFYFSELNSLNCATIIVKQSASMRKTGHRALNFEVQLTKINGPSDKSLWSNIMHCVIITKFCIHNGNTSVIAYTIFFSDDMIKSAYKSTENFQIGMEFSWCHVSSCWDSSDYPKPLHSHWRSSPIHTQHSTPSTWREYVAHRMIRILVCSVLLKMATFSRAP